MSIGNATYQYDAKSPGNIAAVSVFLYKGSNCTEL